MHYYTYHNWISSVYHVTYKKQVCKQAQTTPTGGRGLKGQTGQKKVYVDTDKAVALPCIFPEAKTSPADMLAIFTRYIGQ